MARLFITPREIDFIADVTKELIKDVVGQTIFYYKVREDLSNVNDVYDEAPHKVFSDPVEIEARVEWTSGEYSTTKFGTEQRYTNTVYIQWRDLTDKDLTEVVAAGDFYSYDAIFFEIVSVTFEKQVYGQIEYYTGITLKGVQARRGQIDLSPLGPLGEHFKDPAAVQETFVQQRGFEENRLGKTNDVRALQERGVLDPPISGPAEVSPRGTPSKGSSSFYDDEQ